MAGWLQRVPARIRAQAGKQRVRFTHKALEEIALLELDLDEADCCDILAALTAADAAARVVAHATGEWMCVFKPHVGGVGLYLKLILRDECVVVSFHEEGSGNGDEDASTE